MKTIECPTPIKGMDPAVDAVTILHRGLLDELWKIVSHSSMTNSDKLTLLHELTRPDLRQRRSHAVAELRRLAKLRHDTLTPAFYVRASDYFKEAANKAPDSHLAF